MYHGPRCRWAHAFYNKTPRRVLHLYLSRVVLHERVAPRLFRPPGVLTVPWFACAPSFRHSCCVVYIFLCFFSIVVLLRLILIYFVLFGRCFSWRRRGGISQFVVYARMPAFLLNLIIFNSPVYLVKHADVSHLGFDAQRRIIQTSLTFLQFVLLLLLLLLLLLVTQQQYNWMNKFCICVIMNFVGSTWWKQTPGPENGVYWNEFRCAYKEQVLLYSSAVLRFKHLPPLRN